MLYVNPQTSSSFLSQDLRPGSKGRETEVLQQFEQLFVFQMIKEMRKTVPDYGLDNGSERAYFDEMMDDFMAGEMAKSGQFGIAKQLAEQIAVQKGAANLDGMAREPSPGILLRKATNGFTLKMEPAAAFPLRETENGISLKKGAEAGILLSPSRSGIARYKEFASKDADRFTRD
ncbi:MAG: rod-binding protein [Candidatus Hydrogenedentes bacterium]|nr:rod-binding protein [Candidatus Hydrogenedentota bacterium]